MRTRHASFLLYVGCALLALAPACGGGGGGGGGVVLDAFNGTYHWSQLFGDAGPPLRGTGLWGNATSDGSGMLTGGTSWTISNGVLQVPKSLTPTVYTLPGAGRLHFLAGGVPFAEGGVSGNGQQAILGAVNLGGDPSIALFTRYASGLGNGALNGTYHFAQFLTAPTGTGDAVTWGTATFDGVGGLNFSLFANSNGTVFGPTVVASSYSVTPNGTLTFSINTEAYTGGVRQDGMVAFFSGGTGTGDGASTGLLIKASTAATNATFSGLYHYVGMFADHTAAPAINWRSYTGTMNVDGLGGLGFTTATELRDDGTVVSPLSIPGTYSVLPNGTMTVFGNVVGAVAPDGSVAAFIGGTTNLSDLLIYVMIR